jgi:hypothetical protein
MRAALLVLLLFLSTDVQAARPAMPALSEAEEARVMDGRILLRTEQTVTGSIGAVVGVAEIAATPEAIWALLLDVNSIPRASSSVKAVTIRKDVREPDGRRQIDLTFVLRVAFSDFTYHTIRSYSPADATMTWVLDKSLSNDIAWTEGSYSTWPTADPRRTRLLYRSKVDTGRNLPQWVEEDLTERSLRTYLAWVKKQAEGT